MPKEKQVWDGTYPHCDPRVLHRPGDCITCDIHAGLLQQLRKHWGINFTNQHEHENEDGITMLPCPSEVARPLKIVNAWGGNKARTKEAQDVIDKEYADLADLAEKLQRDL